MTKYLFLTIVSIFFWLSSFAQPHIDAVYKNLNDNPVETMFRYFDDVIDITINNEQSTYSKTQAANVVRNFCTRNGVKLLQVLQSGARNETSFFLIGEVNGTARAHYRVFLFFKQKGKASTLQQIKFETARN